MDDVIHQILEEQRKENYQFNLGELEDALIKRTQQLRKRQKVYEELDSYLADFLNGEIKGIEEAMRVLTTVSKRI